MNNPTTTIDLNWLISCYGFLIKRKESISSDDFALRIKLYYSLNNLVNKFAHDELLKTKLNFKRTTHGTVEVIR